MKTVERSALLPVTPGPVFDVVNDVASYPLFLPWCDASEILESSDTVMRARLGIARGGLRQSFVTLNRLQRPEQIDISLVEGPFRELKGVWRFQPLGDSGCKVSLKLTFEFDSRIAGMALGRVFEQAADRMVDAFSRRVMEVCRHD